MKRFLSALCLSCLLLTGLSACDSGGTQCSTPLTRINMPGDEAPHDMLTEWWYTTGHLWTEEGRPYGYELTIFQSWAGAQVGYVGHFAIIDPEGGEHHYSQQMTAPPERYDTYDLRVGDWRIHGDGQVDYFQANLPEAGLALSLTATPSKPVVFHNGDGLIDMGRNDSWYYTKTRLSLEGSLEVDGQAQTVTGQGWLDHQWGDYAVFDCKGWDWFALQLDTGEEYMIFLLHDLDGTTRITGVTRVDADGCQESLEEASVLALDEWTSPHTGATYPQNWQLEIPEADLKLTLTVLVPDCEMDCRMTTLNAYWEGPVEFSGERAGQAVSGRGFVELAGYGPWGLGT